MELLTTSPPRTHCPITRTVGITSNISDPRIQQSLAREVLAVQVLHAPETARCHGTFFGVVGQLDGRGRLALRVEGQAPR